MSKSTTLWIDWLDMFSYLGPGYAVNRLILNSCCTNGAEFLACGYCLLELCFIINITTFGLVNISWSCMLN